MVKSTRLIALLVMVLTSTVTPLVYQKGVEPIAEGLNCQIVILDIEMDTQYSTDKQLVFTAYLSIRNDAPVTVRLPYLDLDVFQKDQRYELIGKFKTVSIFEIGPYSEISTRKINGEVVKTPGSLENAVVANLTLGGQGIARNLNETIKTLFEGDSIFLQLKGNAQDGPFEFKYQKELTIAQPFFNPDFKIIDIFNYYTKSAETEFPYWGTNNTEANCFVVRAQFDNPSLVPFVIRNYKFNLYSEKTNELIAEGIEFQKLGEVYDPDIRMGGIRKNLIDLYYNGKYHIEVPGIGVLDNKREMFLVFNFTDPTIPYNPASPNSKTTQNINQFIKWLYENITLNDLALIGYLDVNLGYLDDLKEAHGIRVQMGSLNAPPTTISVRNKEFIRLNYKNDIRFVQKEMLSTKLSVDTTKITQIDVNTTSNIVKMNLSATLNIQNPYRLNYSINTLNTQYSHVDLNNSLTEFADGTTPRNSLIYIKPAYIQGNETHHNKNIIVPSNTTIPHSLSLEYDTNEKMDYGLAKIFSDLNIDPLTLNFTNPLWLMGPDGMGNKTIIDPLKLVENLISKRIDPLMLLRSVNVSTVHNYGDRAWRPLGASAYFGTNASVLINNQNTHPAAWGDFPTGKYISKWKYYHPRTLFSNWITDYPEISDEYQFEIIRRVSKGNVDWVWPYDNQASSMIGFISKDITAAEVSGKPISYFPREKIDWRIYTQLENEYWGLKFDNEYYQRGWFFISDGGAAVMLKQNITIPISEISSPDSVENALLSISFRYPQNGDHGRFGIGYWNQSGYIYNGEGNTADYQLWASSQMYGYKCYQDNTLPNEKLDWQHRTVNVTAAIKKAIENYINNGSMDQRYLQLEVAFTALSAGTPIYIDDIDLAVDYTTTKKTPFDIQDFFQRIEAISEVDKTQEDAVNNNNLFKFFDDINFDAANLVSFFEAANGITPGGISQGTNLLTYHAANDAKVSRLIRLFQDLDKIDKIDAGEPLNFLDMLNSTKYLIKTGEKVNQFDPQSTSTNPNSPDTLINKKWGNRTLIQNDGWVIEDPYVASRAFVQAMQEKMFVDERGNRLSYPNTENPYGKELWFMLENLNVNFPWIIIYLIMHGWSKDDIFDLLEALGIMRETKQNFRPVSVARGNMTQTVLISSKLDTEFEVNVLVTTWRPTKTFNLYNNVPQKFIVDFSTGTSDDLQPIIRPMKHFYEYLTSGGDGLRVIDLKGKLASPQVTQLPPIRIDKQSIVSGVLEFGGTETVTFALNDYSIGVWFDNMPSSTIAPEYGNVYLNPGSSGSKGFNSLGVATLTRYIRQPINLRGVPFIEFAGDPLGLFQFLDDFMFTTTTKDGKIYDHSSYTLLNYYDVSAIDFIDIITGWDRFNKTFDPNNNGRADDWYAPENYGFTDITKIPVTSTGDLRGWGNDVKYNRLFYTSNNKYNYQNGKIIWSDTTDFLTNTFWQVYNGKIDLTVPTYNDPNKSQYDFNKGAPPIVNLIDMLTWLTRVTSLDSKTVFDWLEGRLDPEYYSIPYRNQYGAFITDQYSYGIGPQNTWKMLEKMTFNITGMYTWLENIKGADAYGLMYELNNWNPQNQESLRAHGTSSPDPMGLFYHARNPNYVQKGDNSVSFIVHKGIGSDSIASQVNFWKLFNGSWWSQNDIVPNYFGSPSQSKTRVIIPAGKNVTVGPITMINGDYLRMNFEMNDTDNAVRIVVTPSDNVYKEIVSNSFTTSKAIELSFAKSKENNYQIIFMNNDNKSKIVDYSYTFDILTDRSSILQTLPYIILNRLNISAIQQYNDGKRGAELSYNLFQFLLDLYVVPEDWINAFQNEGLYPFEILAVYDSLNIERLLREAANNNKKTTITVSGSFRMNVNGLELYYDNFHEQNYLIYNIDPSTFTAATNLAGLFETYRYSTAQGTYYIHA
jgi:hypothetical protein